MIRILSPRIISRRLRPSAVTPMATTRRRSSSWEEALGDDEVSEGLRQWAVREWDETEEPYVDLFSHPLTKECSDWLKAQPNPSHHLANAYFGSPRFAPERMLLTLLPRFSNHATLPTRFEKGDNVLAWTVKHQTPLQVICEWGNESFGRGGTMVAFDPERRRVLHGNCMEAWASRSLGFRALTGFHVYYAKFLLGGMAGKLEQEAAESPK